MSKYIFVTDCVSSTGKLITPMIEAARGISFETFRKRCDWQAVARQLGYSVGAERGLHLKDDYHVSFHKSVYAGRPCYYLRWSAIEHVFQSPNNRESRT